MHIVVMGVSGCGKSTVARALAAAFGRDFLEGDGLHNPQNIEKMSRGIALEDADRWDWLDRIADRMARSKTPLMVSCSALKRAYRTRLAMGAQSDVLFLHLTAGKNEIAARMSRRVGHFMPLTLLDSQFATLEPPQNDENVITLKAFGPLEGIVARVKNLERRQ